jgi:hypothetical protein
MAVTIPGDYNVGRSVDAADYVMRHSMLGQAGTHLTAGGHGDGDVLILSEVGVRSRLFGFRSE